MYMTISKYIPISNNKIMIYVYIKKTYKDLIDLIVVNMLFIYLMLQFNF